MKTLNVISAIEKDPVGAFLADCWANALSYEEALEVYISSERLYRNFYFSEKMYNLVFDLLDEQYDLDCEYYKRGEQGEETNEST